MENTGAGWLVKVNTADGGFEQVSTCTGWRDDWDEIVSVNFGEDEGLIFYQAEEALAAFHTYTPDGALRFVRSYSSGDGYFAGADLTVPLPLPEEREPGSGLLLYKSPLKKKKTRPDIDFERIDRLDDLVRLFGASAYSFRLNTAGDMDLLDVWKGSWRQSWDSILCCRGAASESLPQILRYDKRGKHLEICDYCPGEGDSDSHLTLRAGSERDDFGPWDHVVYLPPHRGSLSSTSFTLFYRGPPDFAAEFYPGIGAHGEPYVVGAGPLNHSWDILLPGDYVGGAGYDLRNERQLLAFSRADQVLRLVGLRADPDGGEVRQIMEWNPVDEWNAVNEAPAGLVGASGGWKNVVRGQWLPSNRLHNECLLFYTPSFSVEI